MHSTVEIVKVINFLKSQSFGNCQCNGSRSMWSFGDTKKTDNINWTITVTEDFIL